MKTDSTIRDDVLLELSFDPSIRADNIGVIVKNGIVTLNGSVPTYAEKSAVERATKRVGGIRAIAEELTVDLFGSHARDDIDIANFAKNSIDWNTTIPPNQVKVVVDDGWITLVGEVDWFFQSQAALDTVRHLVGIKGVHNEITVKKLTVSADEIRHKIETALKRSLKVVGEKIKVVASEGRISLTGTVHSLEEYDEAGRATWATHGVSDVENDLVVA